MEERTLKRNLKKPIPEGSPSRNLARIYDSYGIVGDIAILRLTSTLNKKAKTVAKNIMDIHSNVRTVLAQTTPVRGDFRLRNLEYIAGENKTATVHKESGCLFSVDLEKCYFSPRLL